MNWKIHAAVATMTAALFCGRGSAAIDTIRVVVNAANASGGNAIGSFIYVERPGPNDTVVKSVYAATFGGGATFRRIDDVDGEQAVTVIANEGEIANFYRDGDPMRGTLTPIISGMILNPAAVGTIPAGGGIWLSDGGTTRLPNSTTVDPAVTKRVYRYNLGTIPEGGDGRDIFSTVATLADFQAAAATAATSGNVGTRQAAFSPNGQTIYAVDSSAAFGGVYAVDPLGGDVTRLVNASGNAAGAVLINSEPAVRREGDADRIFFRGNRASAASSDNNVGGINFVDYDGAAASPQGVALAAADLTDFLETPAGSGDVRSLTFGPDGTLYFYEQASTRLIALDAAGRMYKVLTKAERDLALTGSTTAAPSPNNSVLRLQARQVERGAAGTITQLLYQESTPLNLVAGVDVYKPTDFDRDGAELVADMTLFAAKLTVRDAAAALDDARYDMNGDATIDFHDVEIAQSFQLFPDGDANFDRVVAFGDLVTLAQNYNQLTGQTWVTGDFTGDDAVGFTDLVILAQNYGVDTDPAAVDALGTDFAADWRLAQSLVPEPTALAVAAAGVSCAASRRRR